MFNLRVLVCGAALLGVPAVGFAQSVVNGGFTGNGTGWTFSDTVQFGGGYQNSIGQDGTVGWGWLNSIGQSEIPRVQQTVMGLTIGQDYTISGFYRRVVIFQNNDPFRVQLDGQTTYTGANMDANNWTPFSFDFTAAAPWTVLSLQAEVLGDSDFGVDSIAIQAIPEPATLALLAAGALVMHRGRRRTR